MSMTTHKHIMRLLVAAAAGFFLLAPPPAHAARFEGLGDLAGGGFYIEAYGVSADGNVVVGKSYGTNSGEAFRWAEEDGMTGLGDLAGGSVDSEAYGVSADGNVVVGHSFSASGAEAFRWTEGAAWPVWAT